MSADDPRPDDPRKGPEDEDPFEPAAEDESMFPSLAVPFGWPLSVREEEERTGRAASPEERSADAGGFELGLIGLLLVVGVVLFLFPEPVTSGVGMLLVGAAVVLWLFDVTPS